MGYNIIDVLIGIAYYKINKNERALFRHDREDFNKFFQSLKGEYPLLLKDTNFYEVGGFLECEQLDHAYKVLMFCNMLGSWGSNFHPHEFLDKCKINFEKHKKQEFSDEDLENLEKISAKFFIEFGCSHN